MTPLGEWPRPLLYISGPITNGGTASRHEIAGHVANAQSVAVDLIKAGFAVYCPHSSGHWEREREIPYDQWLQHDFDVIRRCDALYVLPGESRGVEAEIEYAKSICKPVYRAGAITYEELHAAITAAREAGIWGRPLEEPTARLVRYDSGATRSADCEEYRYDLISPEGTRRLAQRYAMGAKTHGDRNWEGGMPAGVVINHMKRHLDLWLEGDTSDDHMAAVAWGAFAIMHYERHRPECMNCGPNRWVDAEDAPLRASDR